jgi:hypothetical protein
MLKEVPSTPALMPSKPSLTGNIAKVASLVAIVIGGHGFADGEPGAKKSAGRYCRRNRQGSVAFSLQEVTVECLPQARGLLCRQPVPEADAQLLRL